MEFVFTVSEAQTILNALAKEPYMEVVGIINNLQSQAAKQINPQEDKPDN